MPPRSRDSMRVPLLAGWLFADLMLLLFVIGLSFAPVQSATVSPRPKPSSTSGGHPSPSPSPSPRPSQRVLNRTYYTVNVDVSLPDLRPGSAAATQLVDGANAKIAQLASQHPDLAGKDVAVAVIFGAGPQTDINTAITEATTAGNILRADDPKFSQASFLPEWTGNPAPTFVELILFFYAS
ncbi:MAG: hypothetical protein JO345_20030 [Streptosporangiaceae bacterium]|nr:hypothetical protein [Streptosporangiaceae bacterium]